MVQYVSLNHCRVVEGSAAGTYQLREDIGSVHVCIKSYTVNNYQLCVGKNNQKYKSCLFPLLGTRT